MKKIIEKEKNPVWYYVRKVMVIAILLLAITGGMIFCISEKTRAWFMRWVTVRYTDTEFLYQNQSPKDGDVSHYSIQDVVPEGFTFLSRKEDDNVIREKFLSEDNLYLSFHAYSSAWDGDFYIYSDQDYLEDPIHDEELDADIYVAEDELRVSTIVWRGENGELFTIRGPLSKDELIELAKKVK